ncbi:MAG: deoxyribodipyrimidine photo-lyase [Ignavibacteriales bacterium]|nr:deoxyribodipyrimidine photo-lyase [Ignavibacteriales bacterium]
MRPIIVWFRRDLRTEDHAALYHACKEHVPVIPLFIFDTELIRSLPSDGAAFNYQAEALTELALKLEMLGGRLISRHGSVMDVHKSLIQEAQPSAIYFNRDYEPYARERERKVEELYHHAGIEVKSFKDAVVHEPDEVLTLKGEPYVVFTPYANAWKKMSHPLPFGKPRSFTTPPLRTEQLHGAHELGKPITIASPAVPGGEKAAHRRWSRFLLADIGMYGEARNIPSLEGTSRMSVALRFGCISVRRMLEDCGKAYAGASFAHKESIRKFVDELIWREFYQSVLYHYPGLVHSSYREEFDSMPWKYSERQFQAWKEGKTGFPIVDAGMRQLNQTGWMHNRVRMVVASFLTKDMRHDWRKGAAYFEEKLMDIETASNNGGWQWSASSGVDPKPLRIFNPQLQSERFDPNGEYIRKFVPELCRVPTKFIHAPHTMPALLQKELGCTIGKEYPKPILDHKAASTEFKLIVASLKANRKSRSK